MIPERYGDSTRYHRMLLSYAKYIINYVYELRWKLSPLPEASSKCGYSALTRFFMGQELKYPDYRWDRPPTNLTTKEHFGWCYYRCWINTMWFL